MEQCLIIFFKLFTMSCIGAIAIFFLWFLKKILRGNVKQTIFYYGWSIVVFFLLVPVLIPTIFLYQANKQNNLQQIKKEQNNAQEIEKIENSNKTSLEIQEKIQKQLGLLESWIGHSSIEEKDMNSLEGEEDFFILDRNEIEKQTEQTDEQLEDVLFELQQNLADKTEKKQKINQMRNYLIVILMILWGCGCIYYVISLFIQTSKLNKALKKGQITEIDLNYKSIVEQQLLIEMQQLKIKRKPQIYYHNNISSPLISGKIIPKIYLPLDINRKELTFILRHELIHCKRYDLLYRLFGDVCRIIHWFNPVVLKLPKYLEEDCELSCDELVINQMDEQEKKAYSKTILMTIYRARNKNTIGNVAFCKNQSFIERRVREIMNKKKRSKIAVIVSVVVLVTLLGGGLNVFAAIQNYYPKQVAKAAMKPKKNSSDTLPKIKTAGLPEIPKSRVIQTKSYNLNKIKTIKLDLSYNNIDIYTTEDSKLKVVQSYPETKYYKYGKWKLEKQEIFEGKTSKDELIISTKQVERTNNIKDWGTDRGTDITIYLPKDYKKNIDFKTKLGNITVNYPLTLEQVILGTNLGNVWIDNNIYATKVNLIDNLGEIAIDGGIKADSLDIVSNLGEVTINGMLICNRIDLTASLGEVLFNNKISCETFKVNSSLGDCKILHPVKCKTIDIRVGLGCLYYNTLDADNYSVKANKQVQKK